MKKKIISAITAIIYCNTVCLTPINACTVSLFNIEAAVKIEESDWLSKLWGNHEASYMISTKNNGATIYFIDSYHDTINFKFTKDIDNKVIERLITKVNDQFIVQCATSINQDYWGCSVSLKNDDGKYTLIDSKTVKLLYNLLSDHIYDSIYNYDMYEYNNCWIEYMTGYNELDYDFNIEEKLSDYLTINNVKATLMRNPDNNLLCIVPDSEITITEHYELSNDIAEKTELHPCCSNNTRVPQIIGKKIYLDEYVNGDANCDKEVGLADALAILQYTANAEKYPLSDQELFNADIVGDGDGVTPLDALEIQKWDAFKII